MKEKLEKLCKKIEDASGPEDIFGTLAGKNKGRDKNLQKLETEYQGLSSQISVDQSGLESKLAKRVTEARLALDELYKWARTSVVNGTYGESTEDDGSIPTDSNTPVPTARSDDTEVSITTKKRDYYITEAISEDDLSTIYKGYYLDEMAPINVSYKITKDPADNGFAKREAQVLEILYAEPNNEGKQLKHLPQIIDQFITEEGQRGNILSYQDGYDLTFIKDKLKKGKNRQNRSRHMVWMLGRLLSVVGYAHSKGVINANISPTNVIIRPRDHNLWLTGWNYSIVNHIQSGAKFAVFDEDYSAPEIEQRPVLSSAAEITSTAERLYLNALYSADLYSVGKCMVYLLGGNLKTNKIPDDVEEPLQRFIQTLLIESPLQRPRDAWEMYGELRQILTALWGPRKFIEFEI